MNFFHAHFRCVEHGLPAWNNTVRLNCLRRLRIRFTDILEHCVCAIVSANISQSFAAVFVCPSLVNIDFGMGTIFLYVFQQVFQIRRIRFIMRAEMACLLQSNNVPIITDKKLLYRYRQTRIITIVFKCVIRFILQSIKIMRSERTTAYIQIYRFEIIPRFFCQSIQISLRILRKTIAYG